jgi:hypothetical protein
MILNPTLENFAVQLFIDALTALESALKNLLQATDLDSGDRSQIAQIASSVHDVVDIAQNLPVQKATLSDVKSAQALATTAFHLTEPIESIKPMTLSNNSTTQVCIDALASARANVGKTIDYSTYFNPLPLDASVRKVALAAQAIDLKTFMAEANRTNTRLEQALQGQADLDPAALAQLLQQIRDDAYNLQALNTATPDDAVAGIDDLTRATWTVTKTFDLAQELSDTYPAQNLRLSDVG